MNSGRKALNVALLAEVNVIAAGGGTAAASQMVSGFRGEGWSVTMSLATREPGPRFSEALESLGLDGMPNDLREDRLPSGRFATYRQYLFRRSIMKRLRGSDILIRVSGYPWLSYTSRVPYVFYVQDQWHATMRRPAKRYQSKPDLYSIYSFPLRRLLSDSGKDVIFVANSPFIKRLTDETWGVSSGVIPPPVDVAKFRPLSLHSKRSNKIIGLGRFSYEKNQLQQVEIARALKREGVDFTLTMVGMALDETSKNYVAEVQKRAAELEVVDRVKLVINAGLDELLSELSDSAIYLHTALMEGFGISVVEAMSAGCLPCLARSGALTDFAPTELTFTDADEAAGILARLISGWKPLDRDQLSKTEKYDIPNFRTRWVNFVKEKTG